MRLILTNYREEDGDPVTYEVAGNPLLTYAELRAGDGIPDAPSPTGDTTTVAYFDADRDLWIVPALGEDRGFTDLEVVAV